MLKERKTSTMSDKESEQGEDVLTRAVNIFGEAQKLCINVKYEWNKLDLVGVMSTRRLAETGLTNEYWKNFIKLAIEHENGDDVETEMWNLIHLRAELKVLVFYDFSEGELDEHCYKADKCFPKGVQRQNWLSEKINLLGNMIAGAATVLPAEAAEYLLIIGNRIGEGAKSKIEWRVCEYQSDAESFSPLNLVNASQEDKFENLI